MNTEQARIPRTFLWLNITQFLGALNDNVFKILIVLFLLKLNLFGSDNETLAVAIPSALALVPFLLFSHAGGVLADRISKRTVIVSMKVLEAVLMATGCAAIWWRSPIALGVVLFLMSTQSALFGPSKYGIIPELVTNAALSRANSFLVGLSYIAIILGTVVPPYWVKNIAPSNYLSLACFCVGVAVLGTITSLRIPKTPARGGKARFSALFVVDIFKTIRSLRADRHLLMTILGAAYFLFLGAFLQQNVLLYGGTYLQLDWESSAYLFAFASFGIAFGALVAGRLSGHNIEFGIVPVGALGLAVSCFLLGWIPPNLNAVRALIMLAGVSSGLFIVPLNAFMQQRCPADRRGEILAANNFLCFLGAVLSCVVIVVLQRVLGLTPHQNFVVVGALTTVLMLMTLRVLPDFVVRLAMLLVTRLFYRIRIAGLSYLPVEGAALLVSNHVTWVDSLLICATTRRRIRFVMGREIYENRWAKPLFRLMGSIPVSPKDGPRQVIASLKAARRALDEGYLVCTFAEGAITRNGNMHGFKPGLERIVKGSEYPIIPTHIGGAWGSIFSYYHGKPLGAFPRRIPYPATVSFGAPLPSDTTSQAVRVAVMELAGAAVDARKPPDRTLPRAFVRGTRRRWFRRAMGDTTGKKLSGGRALVGALALADALEKTTRGQDKVGIVLPASVGGLLTNAAVSLLGKVPVNLNFTSSTEAIASAIRQCEIRTVISSKALIAKLENFQAPAGTLFLEDIAGRISAATKLKAFLKAMFVPYRILMRGRTVGPDDTATVVFSSGSTGDPKGIVLSHHNVISNIESLQTVVRCKPGDHMCGILPFFHSFGYMATMWFPLLRGFEVFFHPNPLDGAKIAEIVREHKLTVLVTTPTFLLSYIRRAKREDFASLRLVIVGAEKLKKKIADKFEESFGIRPVEGYGATELSPVGSVNVPTVEFDRVRQVGTKEGSVGHPLPAVTMKVVDGETGALLPYGERGVLMVKGPNVMQGYLKNPEKTAEVLRDGWYNTGDLAKMDEDGFVFLLDRLSRYSKIGGEMVPHMAVEEKYLDAIGSAGHPVFVTAVPDERKGEQLVVFYTEEAGDPETLQQIAKESDMPNLWKPRKENYFPIDAMPMLGSGKLDLKQLKDLAGEAVAHRPGWFKRMAARVHHAFEHDGEPPTTDTQEESDDAATDNGNEPAMDKIEGNDDNQRE